jgi:hypothetical protein
LEDECSFARLRMQLDGEQAITVREPDPTAAQSAVTSAPFSASSQLFDLNGEANKLKEKHVHAAIKRFCHQIKTGEVFGTRRRRLGRR